MSARLCGIVYAVPEPAAPPPSPLPDADAACGDCRAVLPRAAFYVSDRDSGERDALCRACRDDANRRDRAAKQQAVAW